MRKIFLLLFCSIFAFAIEQNFLEPEEAFKVNFVQSDSKLTFNLELGKDIYLYDEKLKIKISKPKKEDITKKLDIPKPEQYHEFIVHFKNQSIDIPFDILKNSIDSKNYEITAEFQGCSTAGLCYAPMSKIFKLELPSSASSKTTSNLSSPIIEDNMLEAEELNETDTIANTLKDGSFVLILATFFGFGLLLSLTPCVFPMIPILSSIIVKAGNSGTLTASRGFFLSLIYVLSMSLAYTLAGILAGVFGANLQVALQNPYVLTIFAGIFIALAFSMFGYFKLELPQALQNKINKTTDGKEKQGVVGVAIMGFLSALIVGPCVAPPLAGALVYIGQTGDAFLGGAALFVMSLGMGAPLLLIGVGAGKFMPKPGGWMDDVSKIFGIVMLAIAVWMLDRVLDATILMYLWALLFIGASLYLKIFTHILARLIAIVLLLYGITLFIGALSGATNPLYPLSKLTSKTLSSSSSSEELKWSSVKNIEELSLAIKASKKAVMLDFYADWCISCKELEEFTFKNKKVIKVLKNFTLLRVDVTRNTQEDKEIQKKFRVVGPPALIFWDTNNKELKSMQIVGYKNPKDFLKIINKHFK